MMIYIILNLTLAPHLFLVARIRKACLAENYRKNVRESLGFSS